ncbi:MAG: hypothetical protein LIO85_11260 [Rikenellaceae bacterium]|nr:hypothetical protein [Rikenellaceae bacterium]
MSDSGYAKTSVKVINDFLIDIIGSVVPGIIFLFCVFVSVVIPAVMLYLGYPVMPETGTEYATKIDLLVSNTFQGWFWLVIFFIFIILAYAIGNIFYRRDIKDMDRDSFKFVRNKHFYESVIPSVAFSEIRLKERKMRNRFDILKNKCKEPGQKAKKHFIIKYADLLSDYLDADRKTGFKEEILTLLKNQRVKDEPTFEEIIEKLNHMAYSVYLDDTADPDLDNRKPCETTAMQFDINSDFLRENVSGKYLEKLSVLLKNGDNRDPELIYFNATGWYFRFSLRSEFACDTEEYCQFPYLYYDKYLCRREAFHLMKHVKWNSENARSKNALNKLKMRIQLASKDEYSILVKNEAHIRMASSSRVVSYWTRTIAYHSLVVLLLVTLLSYFVSVDGSGFLRFSGNPNLDFAVLLRMGLIMLIPICIILLSNYIWLSVKKFLHYQRLREIFFVLQAYNEIFYNNIRGLNEDLIERIHAEDRQVYNK